MSWELIDKYIESNQDEELKGWSSQYTDFSDLYSASVGNDDSYKYNSNDPDDPEIKRWIEIKTVNFPDRMTIDEYDFIREYLEKITNPLGGYLYARGQYLGYNQTLGLLIPNGMRVNQELTDIAWGNYPGYTGEFGRSRAVYPNLVKLGLAKAEGSGRIWTTKFNIDMWIDRFVVIEAVSWDYPVNMIDSLINLIMSALRFGGTSMEGSTTSYGEGEVYIPGGIQIPSGKMMYMPLAWAINTFAYALKLIKTSVTATALPVFCNFGFKRTVPAPIIDANWGQVVSMLDTYFGLYREISSYYDPKISPMRSRELPSTPSSGSGTIPYNRNVWG